MNCLTVEDMMLITGFVNSTISKHYRKGWLKATIKQVGIHSLLIDPDDAADYLQRLNRPVVKPKPAPAPVFSSDEPTYSLLSAHAETGIPVETLRNAVTTKRLRAVKINNRWRIGEADLFAYDATHGKKARTDCPIPERYPDCKSYLGCLDKAAHQNKVLACAKCANYRKEERREVYSSFGRCTGVLPFDILRGTAAAAAEI